MMKTNIHTGVVYSTYQLAGRYSIICGGRFGMFLKSNSKGFGVNVAVNIVEGDSVELAAMLTPPVKGVASSDHIFLEHLPKLDFSI